MQMNIGIAIKCLSITLIAISPLCCFSWLIQSPTTPSSMKYYPQHHCYTNQKSIGAISINSRTSTKIKTATSLNGIKGFRSWFESTFPNAMTELDSSTNDNISQEFDHVLIDMNQLLHVSLRRARNEDHGLALMIKKLDSYIKLCKPTKSLVLAFDGPPSAAKMATQRKRRLGIYLRSENNTRTSNNNDNGGRYSNFNIEPKYNRNKRKRNRLKEGATLGITPGTKFMSKAKNAILFWAWQRMSNKYSLLGSSQSPNVKIYISSSDIPGEGEVKLLDWLFHSSTLFSNINTPPKSNSKNKTNRRPSIAILGGDSDLVLEALVLPPKLVHDVFVILPHENRRSIVVSLWETTRYLISFLNNPSSAPKSRNVDLNLKHITSLRTDLVLLFILNGNDYLSKIRGSSGFQKLLRIYLKILQRWITHPNNHKDHDNNIRPFLLTPSLDFNIPFCIAFFKELAKQAPSITTESTSHNHHHDKNKNEKSIISPLSILYQLADAGYLPRPATFHVKHSAKPGKQLVILTLGDENINEQQQNHFELHYPLHSPLKVAKHQLAENALHKILDMNYSDFINKNNENNNAQQNTPNNNKSSSHSQNSCYYKWELSHNAEAHISSYLYGILWNLQTYKDGVCTDYAYNYGKRLSPTANQIVSFFKNISITNNTTHLSRDQLLWNDDDNDNYSRQNIFVPPLDAGLSAIAALPSQAKDLVSYPYSLLLENETFVENLYGDCMDSKNNVFNLPLFQKGCTNALHTIIKELNNITNANNVTSKQMDNTVKKIYESSSSSSSSSLRNDHNKKKEVANGRRIYTSNKHWTVFSHSRKPLEHPFAPPPPFCDGLNTLRSNKFLRVSRRLATLEPSLIPNRTKNKIIYDDDDSIFSNYANVYDLA